MNHAQYAHRVASKVVNQNVVGVQHQLACAADAADTTKTGVRKQVLGILCKQFIKLESCGRIVGFDVVVNVFADLFGLAFPKKAPSFARRFEPPSCRFPLGREFGLHLRRWNQLPGIGCVQAHLHLATEPGVVLGRFLRLDEITHEMQAFTDPSPPKADCQSAL